MTLKRAIAGAAATLAAVGMLIAGACSDDNNNNGTQFGGIDGAVGDGGVSNQAQVLAVVMEANTGEASLGQLALGRTQGANARQFAMRMVDEHTAANQRLNTLATRIGLTPEDNDLRRQLNAQTQQVAAALNVEPVATFDRAYLQSQVTMHTQVLDLLDKQLLPAVQNGDLRAELTSMRATVADHLAAAQGLLFTLGDGGPGTGVDAGADAAADGGADAGVDAGTVGDLSTGVYP